jgi:hypothetical protein
VLLDQIIAMAMAVTEHAHETHILIQGLQEKISETKEAAESIGALATVAGAEELLQMAEEAIEQLEPIQTTIAGITAKAEGLKG